MAINPLGGAGPAGLSGAARFEDFGKVMKAPSAAGHRLENAPTALKSPPEAEAAQRARPGKCVVEGAQQSEPSKQVTAAKVLDRVNQAQNRMEQVLRMAESGKSFSPAELLALQTHVYRASQELDLAGKVVEKATGAVKQVLQTQV